MSSSGPWVVLWFGSDCVSSLSGWKRIARLVQARVDDGLRPLVICSAFTGVTPMLEALADDAAAGRPEAALDQVRRLHLEMGARLGVQPNVLLREALEALHRLCIDASRDRAVSPRIRARILAAGERMSSRLCAEHLSAALIDATGWLDAGTCLRAVPAPLLDAERRYLRADVDARPDLELRARLDALPHPIVVTQDLLARDEVGDIVRLAPGDVSPSAAAFAALLEAVRCERWSDLEAPATTPNY